MASILPIAGAQYHWTYALAPTGAKRFITWIQGNSPSAPNHCIAHLGRMGHLVWLDIPPRWSLQFDSDYSPEHGSAQ